MEPEVRNGLSGEAGYLYNCLFDRAAPLLLIENYLRVHELFVEFMDMPVCEIVTLRTIVLYKLDAAAVEVWLRRRGRRHALSAKLMLILYLAEGGGFSMRFSRQAGSRWGVLFLPLFGGALRLLNGIFLKFRYGLV